MLALLDGSARQMNTSMTINARGVAVALYIVAARSTGAGGELRARLRTTSSRST